MTQKHLRLSLVSMKQSTMCVTLGLGPDHTGELPSLHHQLETQHASPSLAHHLLSNFIQLLTRSDTCVHCIQTECWLDTFQQRASNRHSMTSRFPVYQAEQALSRRTHRQLCTLRTYHTMTVNSQITLECVSQGSRDTLFRGHESTEPQSNTTADSL